ncbi:hypothetical protein O5D80_002232 [Batrachochytrium dendrobatidis]|nr:hypothetical protein O5D80_002232 [Batrachochytrium dendrobatidis]
MISLSEPSQCIPNSEYIREAILEQTMPSISRQQLVKLTSSASGFFPSINSGMSILDGKHLRGGSDGVQPYIVAQNPSARHTLAPILPKLESISTGLGYDNGNTSIMPRQIKEYSTENLVELGLAPQLSELIALDNKLVIPAHSADSVDPSFAVFQPFAAKPYSSKTSQIIRESQDLQQQCITNSNEKVVATCLTPTLNPIGQHTAINFQSKAASTNTSLSKLDKHFQSLDTGSLANKYRQSLTSEFSSASHILSDTSGISRVCQALMYPDANCDLLNDETDIDDEYSSIDESNLNMTLDAVLPIPEFASQTTSASVEKLESRNRFSKSPNSKARYATTLAAVSTQPTTAIPIHTATKNTSLPSVSEECPVTISSETNPSVSLQPQTPVKRSQGVLPNYEGIMHRALGPFQRQRKVSPINQISRLEPVALEENDQNVLNIPCNSSYQSISPTDATARESQYEAIHLPHIPVNGSTDTLKPKPFNIKPSLSLGKSFNFKRFKLHHSHDLDMPTLHNQSNSTKLMVNPDIQTHPLHSTSDTMAVSQHSRFSFWKIFDMFYWRGHRATRAHVFPRSSEKSALQTSAHPQSDTISKNIPTAFSVPPEIRYLSTSGRLSNYFNNDSSFNTRPSTKSTESSSIQPRFELSMLQHLGTTQTNLNSPSHPHSLNQSDTHDPSQHHDTLTTVFKENTSLQYVSYTHNTEIIADSTLVKDQQTKYTLQDKQPHPRVAFETFDHQQHRSSIFPITISKSDLHLYRQQEDIYPMVASAFGVTCYLLPQFLLYHDQIHAAHITPVLDSSARKQSLVPSLISSIHANMACAVVKKNPDVRIVELSTTDTQSSEGSKDICYKADWLD